MLPSLSAPEPYLWTCVPAPGVDQVARVLDYFFSFPDRIEGPRTPFAFWRYRVNEILAEDDLQPTDPKEIELRRKGYPFPEALRTEQGDQWWLRYSAARRIYDITVKPENRDALPFDRANPDSGYPPRPVTTKADYEQTPDEFSHPLNAAFAEDEEQLPAPRSRHAPRRNPPEDYREDPDEGNSYSYYHRESREYRYATPKPRRMIQSTKPGYTRWAQPAEIEDEEVPEGVDPENPDYTPHELRELESGRKWYVENHQREPPANWTPWPHGLAGYRRSHGKR